MKTIVLGTTVRDIITNYVGIAVAQTIYLNGCNRISVQGQVKDIGTTPPDPIWVDIEQLQTVAEEVIPAIESLRKTKARMPTNGPMPPEPSRDPR